MTPAFIYKGAAVGFGPKHEYRLFYADGRPVGPYIEMTPAQARRVAGSLGMSSISAASLRAVEQAERERRAAEQGEGKLAVAIGARPALYPYQRDVLPAFLDPETIGVAFVPGAGKTANRGHGGSDA